MKIEVLGTRGKVEPSAPKYQNHTGFLIDDKILIDVGERQYMDRNPEAIIFTHFHPDHGYFIPEDEEFTPGVPHYGPQEHPLIPKLVVVTEKFTVNGYTFTPIPVIHALKLKSLGYVIEKDGKKVLFSGDVAWIEKAHLEEISDLDLIITEATMINKGGRINRKKERIFGHTGVPDLVRIFSPLTNKLVFTHFGDWFFEDVESSPDKLREFSSENVKIIPAYDGFEILI